MPRLLSLVSSLLAILACTSFAPVNAARNPPSAEELLRYAMRFPVVTIPLVDAAPTVDGQINDAEWAGAALLPDFMSSEARQHEGVAPPWRSRVWMQYAPDALYVAFRADYPAWAPELPAANIKRDASSGHESHFDLFISPTDAADYGETWHLCGNAGGGIFDRNLADPKIGMSWNPDILYRARTIPGGWEGEFKLPFASLGVTPKPGDLWRANLFFIRMRPARAQSTWTPWVEWRQRQGGLGYGWLRFGTDGAAVRFVRGVDAADRVGSMIELAGPAAADVSIELLRRTDAFAPEHPAMMMNLARWHGERDVGGAAFLGASIDQLNAEVLKRFVPVAQHPAQRLVPGGKEAEVDLPATPDLGEYLLRYRVTRQAAAGTEVLAAGAVSYRVRPPVSMMLRPMLLSAGVLEVTVDFSNLLDLGKAQTLRIGVEPDGGGAQTYGQILPIKGAEPLTVAVPGANVPPGKHTVRADVLNDAGKALAQVVVPFERPATPEWWTHPVGAQPEVPKPWTPVSLAAMGEGMTVSVWGRDYVFAGGPLPAVVRTTPTRYSTGEPVQPMVELLDGPIALQLRAGGAPVELRTQPARVIEERPSQVVFETLATGGGVAIKGRTTVEFDGLIRVDLEIAAKGKVDALDLVVPFKEEYATLLGNFRVAPGPAKDLPRYLGKLPPLPWRAPVYYAQTVGTDRLGLQWVCDSTRDWRLDKPDQAVELRRAGRRIEEVFHLIDHSAELKDPLRITFGFVALPCKPLPEGWGRLRIISHAPAGLPALDDAAAVAQWKERLRYTRPDISIDHNPGWSGTPWYPYPFQDKAAEAAMRRRIELYHQVGLRYCPHSGWQAISTLIPEWTTFGKEMAIEPETESIGKTVLACYKSPYSAFTAANWEHHARALGIDGVKADTMFPQTVCASPYHDCGWKDHKGRVWPSVNIFATREFFKRLYRTFHGGVRSDGILTAAQTGVPIAAVCSFTDVVLISEGSPYFHARTLKEGYPQDLVRALMVGAPYGLITIHDLKGLPLNAADRSAALLVAGADPRFMSAPGHYMRGYARCAPGMFVFQMPSCDIWDAWDWIDRGGKAVWMPHWENSAALSIKAPKTTDGATAEMYGSMYVQPGKRVLLVVTNYERESVLADVALDLPRLGFAPGAVVHVEDAVTRVPMALEGGVLRLGVLSERFRLVKLWSGDAPRYAEARLGPDLLATGDFEDWPAGRQSAPLPAGQRAPCAVRDDARSVRGKASLRLDKTEPTWANGAGAAHVILTPVRLDPGDYVLDGFLLVEKNFGAPVDKGQEQRDAGVAQVIVVSKGVEYDPPAWASAKTGRFIAEEKTPGWERFLIAFRVTDPAQPVNVELHLGGVGSAWFDNLQLRRVKK